MEGVPVSPNETGTHTGTLRRLLGLIDSTSVWTGKVVSWLSVALLLVMCFEVVMRYAFNAPQLWAHEVPIMFGATMYAMGWTYVHQRDGHIRIDVWYGRLAKRKQALVDVVGHLVVFFPLLAVLIGASARMAARAWAMGERMSLTHWYPPAAPLRTMVVVALCLLALQGVAQTIRAIECARKGEDI